jgi:hypothetical protein
VEFRNPYRGVTERAWLRLDFRAPDGTIHALDLVVDTASDDAIILRRPMLNLLMINPAQSYFSTGWGLMHGGMLQLDMPACGLVQLVHGYGNDIVGAGVAADDPNFMGLVGLPLLRLGEYGGNATDFWFR